MTLPFCGHTGKMVYPNPKAAGIALRKTEQRRAENVRRHVYFCRWCKGFHFGRFLDKVKRTKLLRVALGEGRR